MSFDVDRLLQGFTMRMPAGRYSRFTDQAAESLVGQVTRVDAAEFGLDRSVLMRIRKAKLEDDGRAIVVTLSPIELEELDATTSAPGNA